MGVLLRKREKSSQRERGRQREDPAGSGGIVTSHYRVPYGTAADGANSPCRMQEEEALPAWKTYKRRRRPEPCRGKRSSPQR